MAHAFSDLEGIRIAVEMERRGENFYRRAARLSRTPEAVALLNALAGDEQAHRAEFERLSADRSPLREVPYDDESNAYLSAIAADVVFPQGLMGLRQCGFDDPVAVLTHAITSEKDSILFYTELREHSADARAREVFTEIIRQERGHLSRLQRQLDHITQSD